MVEFALEIDTVRYSFQTCNQLPDTDPLGSHRFDMTSDEAEDEAEDEAARDRYSAAIGDHTSSLSRRTRIHRGPCSDKIGRRHYLAVWGRDHENPESARWSRRDRPLDCWSVAVVRRFPLPDLGSLRQRWKLRKIHS